MRKIQDLVRARDKFYLNHTTITPDRARDFVLSTTEKCASDESARAVACALLSLRDASLLEPFLVFVIKNRIPFYDVVVEALCEAVRKYFENFTKEASENALDIFSILARVGGPTEMPVDAREPEDDRLLYEKRGEL